jgi:Family of unknown function (DUF6090)
MKKINWKYAIGEVFIVMIGIFLAFELQTLNEKRKLNNSTVFYYERLLSDLKSDINSLKESIEWSERVKLEILILIESLESKILHSKDTAAFHSALNKFYRVDDFTNNLVTYNELVSSGKLQLIRNIEIRTALAAYVDGVNGNAIVRERYTKEIIVFGSYVDKYVKTVISPDGGVLISKYDFKELSKDRFLINSFSRIAMRWENNELQFKNGLMRAEFAEGLIEKELN